MSPVGTKDSRTLLFLDSQSRLMQADISDVIAARPARQIYVADTALQGLSLDGFGLRLLTSTQVNHIELWTVPLKAGGMRLLVLHKRSWYPEQLKSFQSTRPTAATWLSSAREMDHHKFGWPLPTEVTRGN